DICYSLCAIRCSQSIKLNCHGLQAGHREAEPLSKNKVASLCFLKIEAGQAVLIGPYRELWTASAFLVSGTTQLIDLLPRIAGIVKVRAWVGTSPKVGNQPSPNCWFLHASSNSTTLTSFGSLKSA